MLYFFDQDEHACPLPQGGGVIALEFAQLAFANFLAKTKDGGGSGGGGVVVKGGKRL